MTITVKEMRIAEINTVAMGIPLIRLMEAAGKSVADTVIEHYPIREKEEVKVVILMGRGGNGGDSLVAARYLSSRGYHVEIIPAYREELINHPDTLENYKI
ncbi:MAG: bifunctional ADP-dependent NAD(P)H-hydrate dehydratase/NAD(P)H-hydrate epimerase, partial [Thermoprotei archaeon]